MFRRFTSLPSVLLAECLSCISLCSCSLYGLVVCASFIVIVFFASVFLLVVLVLVSKYLVFLICFFLMRILGVFVLLSCCAVLNVFLFVFFL